MNPDLITDALSTCFPQRTAFDVVPAGEGDSCRAFQVDRTWLFLFARHELASASLDHAARVLPDLTPGCPVPIPAVAYHGHVGNLTYMGYRCLPGLELTAERFSTFSPRQRGVLASALAAFFRHLHAFDPIQAAVAGVPVCEYPFAQRDAELLQGSVEELYRHDLEALAALPGDHAALLDHLEEMLTGHLEFVRLSPQPLVLLHGEVSGDHVLHDPQTGRVTGIIDWNGMIVGWPARDFLYLYEEYGREFVTDLLVKYGRLPVGNTLRELHVLHVWHTLLRFLWAEEHGYRARGEALRERLGMLLATPAATVP